jgi:hypothetical protein
MENAMYFSYSIKRDEEEEEKINEVFHFNEILMKKLLT